MQKILNSIENLNKLNELLNENQNLFFIKFTATWCGPCKRIGPLVDDWISKLPEDCQFHEIDIDESLELYSFYKTKKLANGIPVIFCWKKDNKEQAPNYLVLGANPNDINNFFNKCLDK